MNSIDLLELEKKILYKELRETKAFTRKDEIIDRILEIEKELVRLDWEISVSASGSMQFS